MADASQIRLGPEEQAGVAEAERLVREAEFGARDLAGWAFWLAGAIALGMSAVQLWTAALGTLPGVLQRSVHLTFALALCYLFYPMTRRRRQARVPWYDLVLGALGVYGAAYVTIHHEALIRRGGGPDPTAPARGRGAG